MSSQPTYPTTADAPGHTDRLVSGGYPAHVNDTRSAVLELHEVTKTYGSGAGGAPVYALCGVSLTVEQGELVAIVGPSGSGKTTLLHIIGTLDLPSSGTVRIDGIDVGGLDDRQLAALRARRIGFVFQQFFLAEHQTVLDNVADGLLYAGAEVRERRELAARALDAVGLAERQHARPTTMSGGQRQRIAIARALVGSPAIVLADEPTGNLDSHTGEQILELLGELNKQGATIIVITHDQDLAYRLQRQVHVRDGLIVSDTTTLPQPAGTSRTDEQG
jgi:putative ABC transport system ATP-binding protein